MENKKIIFLTDTSGQYQYYEHFCFKNEITKEKLITIIEQWLISLYPEYIELHSYIQKHINNPMFYIQCLNSNEFFPDNLYGEEFLEISKKHNFEDPLYFLMFINFEKAFPSFIEYLEINGYGHYPLHDYKIIS